MGFTLLLLYPLAVTGTEVWLSALKYLANLLELRKEAHNNAVSNTKICWKPGGGLFLEGRGFSFLFRGCVHPFL